MARLTEEQLREKYIVMSEFENRAKNEGYNAIAGVDEVGRGPLAGPVVTAAVILPDDYEILGLNDSKKLSEKKRNELDIVIREKCKYSIAEVSHTNIDKYNIKNATKMAMKMAIEGLSVMPDMLLIDAEKLETVDIAQNSIIKGDAKSVSIAAASIIAKVYRDALMCKEHEKYPEYAFDSNKGYGTAVHCEALKKYGPIEIHRRTFIKNLI